MASPANAAPSTKEVRRVAAASLIGTTVEFYDFFIFGTAAALVFGELFYPSEDPLTGTLAAFATFGVAFVARPLGAVIFGHFGDRVSRKKMLIISLVMMGIATVAIGLLPTYQQVGFLAPLLLVVCRLVQGLALGGEWGGAVLMAVEHAPKGRRAFFGSWAQVGVPLGLVLASGAFALVNLLPADVVGEWGWRLPFLLSGILVGLGLYIRLKIEESPAFAAMKLEKKEEKFPAGVVIRKAPKGLLIGALGVAAANIPFYMATVFMLTFGDRYGIERNQMLLAVCVASFIQIFTIPMFGILCDRIGRRSIMMIGCLLTAAMAFPLFSLVQTGSVWAAFIGMIIVLPLCHAMTYGPQAAWIPEVFPTRLRYSGSGIAYTVGGLLFSAPVPFVSAWLLSKVEGTWTLSVYIIIGAVLTFVAVWVSRESRDDEIDWEESPAEARPATAVAQAPN